MMHEEDRRAHDRETWRQIPDQVSSTVIHNTNRQLKASLDDSERA